MNEATSHTVPLKDIQHLQHDMRLLCEKLLDQADGADLLVERDSL